MPHTATIRYRSGRQIHVGKNPERGDFHRDPKHAHRFPTPEAAADAGTALLKYFQVRNPDALTLIISPR